MEYVQGGFSNKFFSSSSWAFAGFAKGGQLFFFWGGGACDAWRVPGMLPRKKCFNDAIWCVLEHIFIISFYFPKV